MIEFFIEKNAKPEVVQRRFHDISRAINALTSNPVPIYTDAEVPAGAGLVFTLTNAPNPASSLLLFNNGVLQTLGSDYTLAGNVITFILPPVGALIAWYRF